MVRPSKKAVLVGVSGSPHAFSLSLYNLKAYAYTDPDIRKAWQIEVIQYTWITIADQTEKVEQLAAQIVREKPTLVGFSCYMWNVSAFQAVARKLREALPEAKILFGGPEMTSGYLREGKYNHFAMDYGVSGEGEHTFLELLRYLSGGTPEIQLISGLSFRSSDADAFSVNAKREPFKTLLEVPSPFLSGVVDDTVLFRPDVEANIETQRGCTLRCAYCIYHKDMDKISYNSVDRTMDEVRYLVNKGVKRIRFVDANFGSKLDHAKDVMRGLIKNKFETKLMFELIPGFIDEELAALIAEFNALYEWNNVTLGMGVQTINLPALHTIRRAIKLEKFEKTFELIKKYSIYTKIDLIIGLPGETLADIERTLEYMMEKLRGSQEHVLCCHLLRGLPGTMLLDIAQQHHMTFTSELEPHELFESKALPRADMLKILRRTAVLFRLVNHSGWVNREYAFRRETKDGTGVHDAYFSAKDRLQIRHMELLDLIIERLMNNLPKDSHFVQERFPYAETWWWSSSLEISNEWLISTLEGLEKPGWLKEVFLRYVGGAV